MGVCHNICFAKKCVFLNYPRELRHKVISSLSPSCSLRITTGTPHHQLSPANNQPASTETHLILSPTLAVRLAAGLGRNWGGERDNVMGVWDTFRYCFTLQNGIHIHIQCLCVYLKEL